MKLMGDWYFIINLIKGGNICYLSKKLNYHRRHAKSVIGEMIAKKRTEKFFNELAFVHECILNQYNINEKFKDKWEVYLQSQWNDFFPGRPFAQIEDYYPFLKYSRLLKVKESFDGER